MKKRLNKIKQLLIDQSLDALLISSVPTITYLTGYSNFSVEEREAYLFITKNEEYILTDGRYATAIEQHVPEFTLLLIGSGVPFEKVIGELLKKNNVKRLGIEENNLLVQEYKILQAVVAIIQHVAVAEIRIRKDADEIAAIEKACSLGDKAFASIISHIKPGVSEKHIASKIEIFFKEHAADISFKPIVAFGSNAAVPHHQTGEDILQANELILLDFGAKVDNYCSDMTRTLFLGKTTKEQKHMYQTVLDAQTRAAEYIQSLFSSGKAPQKELQSISGVRKGSRLASTRSNTIMASAIDSVAREYIISQGFPPIPHSVGHGIGLEVHEAPSFSPRSTQVLEEGMVFSIEPGIYLPNNAGVRIEDLYVIKKTGLRQLTNAPKDLLQI